MPTPSDVEVDHIMDAFDAAGRLSAISTLPAVAESRPGVDPCEETVCRLAEA